ncbi:hypothetical protein NL50_14895 [Clostridium acetobutylicum]|nr:hypothetical protein NL50_14895 [Clostridium acetobutylicum]
MHLNPDCLRDILLYVEDNINNQNKCIAVANLIDSISSKCDEYDEYYIHYHIIQLNQAGMFTHVTIADGNIPLIIMDLSWQGHQFLATIRGETVWNQTKSVANKVGSFSLDTLSKIATGVVTQLINKHMTGN